MRVLLARERPAERMVVARHDQWGQAARAGSMDPGRPLKPCQSQQRQQGQAAAEVIVILDDEAEEQAASDVLHTGTKGAPPGQPSLLRPGPDRQRAEPHHPPPTRPQQRHNPSHAGCHAPREPRRAADVRPMAPRGTQPDTSSSVGRDIRTLMGGAPARPQITQKWCVIGGRRDIHA